MATRSSSHAKEEKAIFDAFLTVHPSFAAQVKHVDQPDEGFPDATPDQRVDSQSSSN